MLRRIRCRENMSNAEPMWMWLNSDQIRWVKDHGAEVEIQCDLDTYIAKKKAWLAYVKGVPSADKVETTEKIMAKMSKTLETQSKTIEAVNLLMYDLGAELTPDRKIILRGQTYTLNLPEELWNELYKGQVQA